MEPELPTSLPAKLYLLAYNLEKDQMFSNRRLGRALRAAALVELESDGWLVDDHGLVRPADRPPGDVAATPSAKLPTTPSAGLPSAGSAQAGPTPRGGVGRADPLVAAVYGQIRAAPVPRSWTDWIDHDHRSAVAETRDDLEAAGWLRVARGRLLSLIPTSAVVLLGRARVRELDRAAGRVLRGEVIPAQAAPDLVPLVALAAAGQVITLVPAGQRRAFADRIDLLITLSGPAASAFAGRSAT